MFLEENEALLKNRISTAAEIQFFKYGFMNTTMQELASELQISKKTLYKYFASKEELLWAVIDNFHQKMEQKINEVITQPNLDFIEKMKELTKTVAGCNAQLSPQFLKEIEQLGRSKAMIWAEQEEKKHLMLERILIRVENFFAEGISKQMIRPDLNLKLVTLALSHVIRNLLAIDAKAREEFSVPEILDTITKLFIEGLLTEQARQDYLT